MIGDMIRRAIRGEDHGWMNRPAGDDYWYGPRGEPSGAGVDVSETVSLTYSTVYACVNKIAKTISSLPVHVYRGGDNGTRQIVDHPLATILRRSANPECYSFALREAMLSNVLLWGNWWGELLTNNGGDLMGLRPLMSRDCKPVRLANGTLAIEYRQPGKEMRIIPWDRLWHVPGLTLDGLLGLSVIRFHALTVGAGIAMNKFGASYFGNGARPGGFIERPRESPKLTKETAQQVVDSFNERFQGPGKAHGIGLLEEGMTYRAVGVPPEDAQFLESRQFQRVEICSIFDVPPSKIQDDSRSTLNNIEQKNIDFCTDTLLPWCVRIETAAAVRFFGDDEALYLKHNLGAIQRGAHETRYKAYALAINNRIMCPNEVRELEELPPYAGGDEFLVPKNIGNAGGDPLAVPGQTRDENQQAEEDDTAPLATIEPVLVDAAERIVARESRAVANAFRRRAKEDSGKCFAAWLDEFYADQEDYVAASLAPAFRTLDRLGASYAGTATDLAGQLAGRSKREVSDLLATPQGIPGLIECWQRTKAAAIVAATKNYLTPQE